MVGCSLATSMFFKITVHNILKIWSHAAQVGLRLQAAPRHVKEVLCGDLWWVAVI